MSALLIPHVVISLVGIASGFVVAYGLVTNKAFPRWTALFLSTTIATSVSGFLLPADRILPAHILGVLSLITLSIATYAEYGKHHVGVWRPTYIVTALISQYFNVFVLVVQSFQKIPALKALAPTQTEPVFVITQLAVLVAFIVIGALSLRRFGFKARLA